MTASNGRLLSRLQFTAIAVIALSSALLAAAVLAAPSCRSGLNTAVRAAPPWRQQLAAIPPVVAPRPDSAAAAAAPYSSPNNSSSGRAGRDYLGFCLVVKNQHEDIREWVEHHTRHVGASIIYLYDHLSDPPLNDTVADYIESGMVRYTWWGHGLDEYKGTNTTAQFETHTHCLREHGPRHQFLGLLDNDEFLIITDGSPGLPDILRRMQAVEPIGALAVFWRTFGSSGRETRPEEGMLKGFTKCMDLSAVWSHSVKVIANTDYAVSPAGHIVKLNDSSRHVVTEHFQRVSGSHPGGGSWDVVALNHYLTGSKAQYAEKIKRKSASGLGRGWGEFNKINEAATHNCTDAAELYA